MGAARGNIGMPTPCASQRSYGVDMWIGREPCEIAAIKEADFTSARVRPGGVYPPPCGAHV